MRSSKAKTNDYNKKYRAKNKARTTFNNWKSYIKVNYGITELRIVDSMNKQKGCCDICGDSLVFPESKTTYHIDHCHSTGKARGLLCSTCNTLLGCCKDSVSTLDKAKEYLLKHRAI